MEIRKATETDFEAIWPTFRAVAAEGETYPYPRDVSFEEGKRIWMEVPSATFLAEENGAVLGTYYIKPNAPGAGAHVCNCGYMVAENARGRGIATAMGEHSQQVAREMGFKAMQFNLIVTTNTASVKLWPKLGFEIIGCLPKAFKHPAQGYVDALVMYKWLAG
ncbi:GNAT family N-acetyltransferase [Pontiellaceae bacterium B12227]|nr:GNAT family N-acetyltransferase [Pontiellaceae bacterium B12227]